jgi:hypothetical protein
VHNLFPRCPAHEANSRNMWRRNSKWRDQEWTARRPLHHPRTARRSWAQREVCAAGFGAPLAERRLYLLASRHGDARDVLLAEVGICGIACLCRFDTCLYVIAYASL